MALKNIIESAENQEDEQNSIESDQPAEIVEPAVEEDNKKIGETETEIIKQDEDEKVSEDENVQAEEDKIETESTQPTEVITNTDDKVPEVEESSIPPENQEQVSEVEDKTDVPEESDKNEVDDVSEQEPIVSETQDEEPEKEEILPEESNDKEIDAIVPENQNDNGSQNIGQSQTSTVPVSSEESMTPTVDDSNDKLAVSNVPEEAITTSDPVDPRSIVVPDEDELTLVPPQNADSETVCNLKCFGECVEMESLVPKSVIQDCIEVKCHCKLEDTPEKVAAIAEIYNIQDMYKNLESEKDTPQDISMLRSFTLFVVMAAILFA